MTALPNRQNQQQQKKYEQHRAGVIVGVVLAVAVVNLAGIVLFMLLVGAGNVNTWPTMYGVALFAPTVAFYVLLRAMNSLQLSWTTRTSAAQAKHLSGAHFDLAVLKLTLNMTAVVLTIIYAVGSIAWVFLTAVVIRLAFSAGPEIALMVAMAFISGWVLAWLRGGPIIEGLRTLLSGERLAQAAYASLHPRH